MFHSLALLASLLLFCQPTFAQTQSEQEVESLRGLGDIKVVVEEIDADARIGGISVEAIRTEAELRLRRSGIGVLRRGASNTQPGGSSLYINLHVKPLEDLRLIVYSLSVSLKQNVYLVRDSQMMYGVATWDVGSVGDVGFNRASQIIPTIGSYVDRFANDYLSVNPRR